MPVLFANLEDRSSYVEAHIYYVFSWTRVNFYLEFELSFFARFMFIYVHKICLRCPLNGLLKISVRVSCSLMFVK